MCPLWSPRGGAEGLVPAPASLLGLQGSLPVHVASPPPARVSVSNPTSPPPFMRTPLYWIETPPKDLTLTFYLCKNPVPKQGPALSSWELGLP